MTIFGLLGGLNGTLFNGIGPPGFCCGTGTPTLRLVPSTI